MALQNLFVCLSSSFSLFSLSTLLHLLIPAETKQVFYSETNSPPQKQDEQPDSADAEESSVVGEADEDATDVGNDDKTDPVDDIEAKKEIWAQEPFRYKTS